MDQDTANRASRFADLMPFHIRLVGLITLLLVSDGYDTQAIGYVAPALAAAWGVERSAFGPVFSIGLFGVMIGALCVSMLADRVGARRVLLACALVYGLLTLATPLAGTIDALMAMRFVAGIALGGAMPTAIALVADHAPIRLRALVTTIAVCGFSIGGALGGVAATAMIADFGWQSVFIVGGIAPLVLLPFLYIFLPRTRPDVPAHHQPSTRRFPVVGLFADGLTPSTLLLWLVYFMNLLVLYTLSNWLPSIITLNGLDLAMANLATTFYQLGGTVGAVLIAALCDHFRPQRVLAVTFAGAAAAVFLIGAAGAQPVLVVVSVAAAGFCVVGGQNAANAFVGGFYPTDVRASGLGWALGVGRLGSILGPLMVGALLAGGTPTRTIFELAAIPAAVAACAIWLVGRRARN